MTLNGVIALICVISLKLIALLTSQWRYWRYCLQNIVFHFWPKLTHPAARSLSDSWAACDLFLRCVIQTMQRQLSTSPWLCQYSAPVCASQDCGSNVFLYEMFCVAEWWSTLSTRRISISQRFEQSEYCVHLELSTASQVSRLMYSASCAATGADVDTSVYSYTAEYMLILMLCRNI